MSDPDDDGPEVHHQRLDVHALLDKLRRNDFRYREFADPFADMELWPMFEVLLTDERIVGPRTPVRPVIAGNPVQTIRRPVSEEGQGSGLLAGYRPPAPPSSGAKPTAAPGVRGFLKRLSTGEA